MAAAGVLPSKDSRLISFSKPFFAAMTQPLVAETIVNVTFYHCGKSYYWNTSESIEAAECDLCSDVSGDPDVSHRYSAEIVCRLPVSVRRLSPRRQRYSTLLSFRKAQPLPPSVFASVSPVSFAWLGLSLKGLDCALPGYSLSTLPLNSGYWRASTTSLYIRECYNEVRRSYAVSWGP